MQLDTQKHEVSQYLRSAHANRHAEARVSRRMKPRHAESYVYVVMSPGIPDQSTQDIDVGFWDLTSRYQDEDLERRKRVPDIGDGFRARIAGPPPASPIEDRGTAIPIEDRDRTITERLRNPGSLSETSSLTPHILLQVTSRKDHSARGTVGAGVDWTSFAKDSFSRYMNVSPT
ncbi:hypothetical protein F2Q69_00004589 [Brassica cretica]|uniref:Uncharacterized protein n=1 Tax=Brassica cretica TaxID=69181 RepID=A0A8S9NY76_BRACR|nr:hypothetical protein F2Q69_00004589 [Brassica cretica]